MKLAIDPLTGHQLKLQVGPIQLCCEIDLAGSDLQLTDGHMKIRATRCGLRDLLVTTDSWKICSASAEATNLRVDTHGGGQVAMQSGEINVGPIDIVGTATQVKIEELSLLSGFEITTSDEILIPELVVRNVIVAISLIPSQPSPPPPAGEVRADGRPKLADYAFLDALSGHIHVDLDVDVTVPVIGRRKATHAFRVPITDGTIDFHKLEANLSALENAVLDFEVKDGQLILEKDLPLIPFDNTTLVSWDLDDDAQALANRSLVRLRTLLGYQINTKGRKDNRGKASDGGRGVVLHSIAAKNFDLKLGLTEPVVIDLGALGRVHLGVDGRPGIASLTIAGEARHRLEVSLNDAPPEQTSATVGVGEVNAKLDQLRLGARSLSVGAIHLGAIESATLSLIGFVPDRLELKLTELVVHDLRLSRCLEG